MKKQTRLERFEKIYLDYVNNFLNTERFASYYSMSNASAKRLITTMYKIIHTRGYY